MVLLACFLIVGVLVGVLLAKIFVVIVNRAPKADAAPLPTWTKACFAIGAFFLLFGVLAWLGGDAKPTVQATAAPPTKVLRPDECDESDAEAMANEARTWTRRTVSPVTADFDWHVACIREANGELHEKLGFSQFGGSIRHATYCALSADRNTLHCVILDD